MPAAQNEKGATSKRFLCIAQSEDRAATNYNSTALMELNARSCRQDLRCAYHRLSGFANVEPHWRKLFLTHQLLLGDSACAAVAWLVRVSCCGSCSHLLHSTSHSETLGERHTATNKIPGCGTA
eukprot:3191373-Prymnesium_polylepis.1